MRVFRERRSKMFLFGMRAITLGAAVACMLAMVVSQGVQAVQPTGRMARLHGQEDVYVPGEVLVLLSADVDRNGVVEAAEGLFGVESALNGTVEKRITFSHGKEVLRVALPAGKSVEDAIGENWGARDRRILVVEPNYRVRIAWTPNDPRFQQLWGMHNTGQTGGTEDADIDAPEAWDIATGVPDGSDVIVGIIDSGIDYLHPDLADNMWVNPGEIPGNGIDDDNNGYIDDVHGYDFYRDDGDPSDAAGHGTHCAGTIAGVGDNGLGVAGVNWQCKLMALRTIDAGGGGNIDDAIDAIIYGVANGAKILSSSWGGNPYSLALEYAIIHARNNGVLFVAAAGNYGWDTDSEPYYPASYEVSNVISVAATDHKDLLASFSNFGDDSVDLGAPGASILSTFPTFRTLFFEDFQGAATPSFSGTQMTREGVGNYWGTVLSPLYYDENNIAARGDLNWPYSPGSYGSIVTSPIDTRGLRGLTVEFEYMYEIGEGDELSVYVWDGSVWQTVFSIGDIWSYMEGYYWFMRIDIPDSYRNEEMKIRFRWSTNGEDNNYFGAEVDNIRIQCVDDHAENYVWNSGTSMAASHVAGVAALVMANIPGSVGTVMELEELKTRLVWTGDPVPALDGKTISGCRLNAYNALTATTGLKVAAPNGGDSLELSRRYNIRWYSINGGPFVDIYLLKGGSVYMQLANNVPNNNKFSWNIPESLPADSDYRIRITDGTYSDESDEDFELFCPSILKPDYPDPCDGARDVALDIELAWKSEGALDPVTITFDDVDSGTMVHDMIIEDVTFGFFVDEVSSGQAYVIGGGSFETEYVQLPCIDGNSDGILVLDFAIPVYGVSYGFLLASYGYQQNASTMVLIDSSFTTIGTFSADANDMGFVWMEGMNSGTSTKPIAHAIISFTHYDQQFKEFLLDNLTYSPLPGGLPEASATAESGDTVEADSGEYQIANGIFGGSIHSLLQFDFTQPEYLLPGVRTVDESGAKESEAPEAMAMAVAGNIGELHSGGPDAGYYTFIDSDEPDGPSFDWIEIATGEPPPPPPPPNDPPPPPPPGSGETVSVSPESTELIAGLNLHLSDDSFRYPIMLPFKFSFYGSKYNYVAIGSNGGIYFVDQYLTLGNRCIPSSTSIESFIAVYWDDLYPNYNGDDNVYAAVVGEEPNRILVVQWENVMHCCSDSRGRVTAQAQLFEKNGDILLLYVDPSLDAGSEGTIGIQRDASCGLNYLCNEAKLHPGLAVLFRYDQPCPMTWDVYFGTDPNALDLIESGLTKPICDPTPEPGETLERGMRYYWQVVASSCCGAVDGNDWSFTTENTLPVADAGDEQTVECACNTGQGTQVTLDSTRSSDAEGTPLTCTWTGPFIESPVQGEAPTVTLDSGCTGEYVITLIVNDGIDDSEPNDVVITVVDTTPPVVNCPADVTLECPADTNAATTGMATASDTGGSVTVAHNDQWQKSCGNAGTLTRTWTATDESGNSSECVQTITVVDTKLPEFEFSVTPTFMWPPTHKMVEVTPSWTVSDECDAAPQVSLVGIVMSEDDNTVGDGHTTGDIEIGDDGEIYVRSERSGANSGRIYTITYQAVDDCGNVTVRSATVSIPHDFKVLARIADRWLLTGREGSIQVDFNGDGIVNLADFARFAENWIQ